MCEYRPLNRDQHWIGVLSAVSEAIRDLTLIVAGLDQLCDKHGLLPPGSEYRLREVLRRKVYGVEHSLRAALKP